MFMSVALHGFLVGLSLIIAIGPQNALVLKQGLKRQAVGVVVAVCALSDVALIFGGTAGVGVIVERLPILLTILTYGGAVYLVAFALSCFRDALHPKPLTTADAPDTTDPTNHHPNPAHGSATEHPGGGVAVLTRPQRTTTAPSWRGPALAAFVLTWLNPGAYIDTVVMLGGLANQEGDPGRWIFAAGALAASLTWFPLLGFGASKLSGPLSRPAVWQVLNVIIGVVMLGIAARLVLM